MGFSGGNTTRRQQCKDPEPNESAIRGLEGKG